MSKTVKITQVDNGFVIDYKHPGFFTGRINSDETYVAYSFEELFERLNAIYGSSAYEISLKPAPEKEIDDAKHT